jgi:hypothetical protein
MDIIAHGLSGGVAFGWKRKFLWALWFGILPDLLAFGPFFIHNLLSGNLVWGKPQLESIPAAVFTAYNFSHSLFTATAIVLLLRFLASARLAMSSLAYPLHILLDVPTHTESFFPTPFLFPVSDFKVDGISWGNSYFMLGNYGALAVAYFFYFRRESQRRKTSRQTQPVS